jgi:hypothetical protein
VSEGQEPRSVEDQGDRTLLGEYPEQDPKLQVAEDIAGETWTKDIDAWPERSKDEDPRWAIRTVWIWMVFCMGCIGFVTTLLILGAILD